MIKAQAEYKLKGSFRVRVFDKKGQMVEDTGPFNNFITPTGLSYPTTYPFVDCFRFLSLGIGTVANSGEGVARANWTTGLNSPISTYTCADGSTEAGQYIDYRGYVTGDALIGQGCGTISRPEGPVFYRSWQIPTGQNKTMGINGTPEGLVLQEFMVSPSSGSSATGRCAFSRVRRQTIIPPETYAIITYELKMSLRNTGINYFNSGTFTTGGANVADEGNLVQLWNNLSGIYRQCYHGLQCIDNAGLSYIPRYGDSMEPSNKNYSRLIWYLSPDNSQFCVNSSGQYRSDNTFGCFQLDENAAYRADGLYRNNYGFDLSSAVSEAAGDDLNEFYSKESTQRVPSQQLPSHDSNAVQLIPNIRLNTTWGDGENGPQISFTSDAGGEAISKGMPRVDNYTTGIGINYSKFQYNTDDSIYSFATAGASGKNENEVDMGLKAVFSSRSFNLPFNTGFLNTGYRVGYARARAITRKSFFLPSNSLGRNTRMSSMVYGYYNNEEGIKSIYPSIDCLYFDTSGRYIPQHYREITGLYLSERGSGVMDAWFYLDPPALGHFNVRAICGPYNETGFIHPLLGNVPEEII